MKNVCTLYMYIMCKEKQKHIIETFTLSFLTLRLFVCKHFESLYFGYIGAAPISYVQDAF